MIDSKQQPSADSARRRLLSALLFPLALFPMAALFSYDWRAIAALNVPPAPTTNWIGPVGDLFSYYGYLLFGLAIWTVPVFSVIVGILYIMGRRLRRGIRHLSFLIFIVAFACLLQILGEHAGWVAEIARRVNTPNAGGAVGYLLMTRALLPLVSDFGSSIIMSVVMIAALVGAIGPRNILSFFTAVYAWAMIGRTPAGEDAGGELTPDQRQEEYLAALRAKDAARAEAKAEKERVREEKERAKAEKAAEKERLREEKERERERIRQAREAEPAPAATREAEPAPAAPEPSPYVLPSLSLLNPRKVTTADHSDVKEMSDRLINTLKIFNIDATLSYTVPGPVVTKYAIELSPGTRYATVTSISDELMGALHAKSIRIEAPIPGEDRVGIEVPNLKPAGISFREIFESDAWRNTKAELPLLFGKNAAGKELIADLASMPHMLVAGATGQGKSVCLNAIINGLLMTRTPEQLKLIMVDPKSVEFTAYASIPHLLVPVITDNRKVVFSLHWAVAEMEKRLKLFARAHVRNIYDYNHRKTFTQTDMFGEDTAVNADMPKTVPYIVVIIDEVADLMSQCAKEVTPDISRLTAKARAAGIHLILATQRPDAKVITGTIKANIPGRVAFKTAQAIDSRTILDEAGAENLIGRGDMLFKGKDGLLVRAQGAWISDEEIARVTEFIGQHSTVQFDEKFSKNLGRVKEAAIEDPFAALDAEDGGGEEAKAAAEEAREQVKAEENASDFKKAVECIINTNRASTSHFQRKLGWGYNHSAKIMDMLEDAGIIGPQIGAGPRTIIMDQEQLLAVFNGSGTTEPASAAAENSDGTSEESLSGNDTILEEEQP